MAADEIAYSAASPEVMNEAILAACPHMMNYSDSFEMVGLPSQHAGFIDIQSIPPDRFYGTLDFFPTSSSIGPAGTPRVAFIRFFKDELVGDQMITSAAGDPQFWVGLEFIEEILKIGLIEGDVSIQLHQIFKIPALDALISIEKSLDFSASIQIIITPVRPP